MAYQTCCCLPVLLLKMAFTLLTVMPYQPANATVGTFKIGAFNIQILAQTKMSKPDVVASLVLILRRYDIVLIQEIRDSKQTAIIQLLNKVNDDINSNYGLKQSVPLGRTSSKEQYAFIYRLDRGITLTDTYQFPDDKDVFEREPFSALFTSTKTAIKSFVLTAIHTKPTDAEAEINALDEVHAYISNHWNNPNVLIMGDFNADCSYLANYKYEALDMIVDQRFHWLIPDDWDTTMATSSCAYDRFVMTGDAFLNAVQHGSVQVYDFKTALALTNDEAAAVSDHYPIELILVEKYGYL